MSEKALKEFIEASRKKGLSDEKIESILLEKGWDAGLVKDLIQGKVTNNEKIVNIPKREEVGRSGEEFMKEDNWLMKYLDLFKNGILIRTPNVLDIKEGLIFFSVVMGFLFLWAGVMFDLIRNIIILILMVSVADFLFYAIKSSDIGYEKIILGDEGIDLVSEKRGSEYINYKNIRSIRPGGDSGWMAIPALIKFNNYFILTYKMEGNIKKAFLTFDFKEALDLTQKIAERSGLEKKGHLIWSQN